jgi:hypothetical protein
MVAYGISEWHEVRSVRTGSDMDDFKFEVAILTKSALCKCQLFSIMRPIGTRKTDQRFLSDGRDVSVFESRERV